MSLPFYLSEREAESEYIAITPCFQKAAPPFSRFYDDFSIAVNRALGRDKRGCQAVAAAASLMSP